jgi:hypothetical protein
MNASDFQSDFYVRLHGDNPSYNPQIFKAGTFFLSVKIGKVGHD